MSEDKQNNPEEQTTPAETATTPESSPLDVELDQLYVAEEKVEVVEPDPALPNAEFDSLDESIKTVLKGQGWNDLTLVQKKTIPYMREGRDMMILSKTGSGKTGAFLIPLLEVVEVSHLHPQALILAPTRELALQVEEEAKKLGGPLGVKTVSLYGGVKYQKQIDTLQAGVHLVIATPGRLIDHLQRKI